MKKHLSISLSVLTLLALVFIWPGCDRKSSTDLLQNTDPIEDESTYFYGIKVDSLNIIRESIAPNAFLADILLDYRVDYNTIHQITQSAKDVFDFRQLRAGQNYYVLHSNDSTAMPQYFIYDKNAFEYIVCDIRNSICVYVGKKPIRVEEKVASGEINHSLYMTLDDNDIHPTLALKMADIYAWTIDFYHLQKGDRFKVIYEEEFVDSISIGVRDIKGALFEHYGEDFYANKYHLERDTLPSYFDDKGGSLQRTFLKSPLEFGRLTSRYSGRRFHPVQKRYKAHLGTDYAAPTGTPIRSTADGVIEVAGYKKYNGNYVKVRHNSTYMTQYLHMSKIAKGIVPGKVVTQGQTIGYVGSTGLATGPHVCYRFWKNGKQVDATKQELPPSDPVPDEELEAYLEDFRTIKRKLDSIPYPLPPQAEADSTVADLLEQ